MWTTYALSKITDLRTDRETRKLQKMLRLLWCCCVDDSNNERQPLLHPRSPSEKNEAESARQTRPAHTDSQTVRRIGRLTMRRVNVPELDHRFTEMAELFNEQQEHYEAMMQHIRNLKRSCSCVSTDNLTFSESLKKIRDEQQDLYRVSLKMKGYDFSLTVDPVGSEKEEEEEPLPLKLQLAQDEVKCVSDSAKAAVSKGTSLQQLTAWLLRSHGQMTEQVKEAAETFQEQGRLKENLDENIKEVKRAKELSQGYRKQAADIFSEGAEIAGVSV